MSTSIEFIHFVVDQLRQSGVSEAVRYRKMFGEYMVYIDDRPILLVCDDTVFVKKLDCISDMMSDAEVDMPYNGAKEHYILDVEDVSRAYEVIKALVAVTPVPVKKKRKKTPES